MTVWVVCVARMVWRVPGYRTLFEQVAALFRLRFGWLDVESRTGGRPGHRTFQP
jgi:hypothetical protein